MTKTQETDAPVGVPARPALTVPARPVAVGMANAATIAAASLYAATGPVGVAAVAAAALGAGAVTATRRHRARVARTAQGHPTGARRASRTARTGLRTAQLPAHPSRTAQGGARTPSRAARTAHRAARALRDRAAPLARGSARALRTAQTGSRTARALAARAGAPILRSSRAARAGLRTEGSALRGARAARRIAARRGGWSRGVGTGLAALAAGGVRDAVRSARSRARRRRDRAAAQVRKDMLAQERAHVADRVRTTQEAAHTQERKDAPVSAARPARAHAAGSPARAGQEGVVMEGIAAPGPTARRMLELAGEMRTAATVGDPQDMMEVVGDYGALPDILEGVAAAVSALYERAAERYPLHPAVIDTIGSLHRAQLAVADTARDITRAVMILHEADIARVVDPRVNEAMWNVDPGGAR